MPFERSDWNHISYHSSLRFICCFPYCPGFLKLIWTQSGTCPKNGFGLEVWTWPKCVLRKGSIVHAGSLSQCYGLLGHFNGAESLLMLFVARFFPLLYVKMSAVKKVLLFSHLCTCESCSFCHCMIIMCLKKIALMTLSSWFIFEP